jgi:hypothetical protein
MGVHWGRISCFLLLFFLLASWLCFLSSWVLTERVVCSSLVVGWVAARARMIHVHTNFEFVFFAESQTFTSNILLADCREQ